MSDPFIYSVINTDTAKESCVRELQFSVIKVRIRKSISKLSNNARLMETDQNSNNTLQVKGQSFMLHQIRKMIGMAIAVVRGDADESVITDSWNTDRIDIPRAPGLGLMLDEVRKYPLAYFSIISVPK